MTLHPSVGFVDCGELAAVCYTFGIPHPTGYPLFLVIGFVVSHLPLPGSVIYRLNTLAAIETALAVFAAFYVSLNLLREFSKIVSAGKQNKKSGPVFSLNENDLYTLSFAAAIVFGFTGVIWFYATQVEVYSLHSLFVSLIFYFMIRIFLDLKTGERKMWVGLILVLSFSFANHSTTIYFVPGLLYLFYLQRKANPVFAKSLLKYLLLLLPGALMYLILVFRASQAPFF